MNLVVIGNGAYVSGRGTNGYGTIFPAIIEYIRNGGAIDEVHMIGTNRKHSLEAMDKINELTQLTGVNINLTIYPNKDGENKSIYKNVLNKIDNATCAIIAVPDHLHFQIAQDCLKAGLHTLLVKPFTPSVKEALSLIKVAKLNKLYGSVEFHKRWDKHNLMLRDIFRAKRLGDTALHLDRV